MPITTSTPAQDAVPPWGTTRLSRLSAFMCFAVALGGALAELALAWVWLSPSVVETYVAPHIGLANVPIATDGATRLAGFAISMVPMAVLLFALCQAGKLFDAYRVGQIFVADAPLRLRRVGLCMLALALLRPATGAALTAVLTAANAPGLRMVSVGISIDDYMIAVFGGLILAIGHVMQEARTLEEDNKLIV